LIVQNAGPDAEKAAASKKTAQCTSCKSTTAVDLKLTATAPSEAVASSLPPADFIAITWTQAETQAAAQVFGNGKYKFLGADNNNFTPLLFPNLVKPSGEQYQGSGLPELDLYTQRLRSALRLEFGQPIRSVRPMLLDCRRLYNMGFHHGALMERLKRLFRFRPARKLPASRI
jgi:hypothetical protein